MLVEWEKVNLPTPRGHHMAIMWNSRSSQATSRDPSSLPLPREPIPPLVQEGVFQALPYPVRITVMGGGNFGLALSLVLARNEVRIRWWCCCRFPLVFTLY